MDIKNYVVRVSCFIFIFFFKSEGERRSLFLLFFIFCKQGQTAFDVADLDMVRTLEELKKKQATLQRDTINTIINKKAAANTPKRRSLSICLNLLVMLYDKAMIMQ